MPRRTDLHKILIIGSGLIVIGQIRELTYVRPAGTGFDKPSRSSYNHSQE